MRSKSGMRPESLRLGNEKAFGSHCPRLCAFRSSARPPGLRSVSRCRAVVLHTRTRHYRLPQRDQYAGPSRPIAFGTRSAGHFADRLFRGAHRSPTTGHGNRRSGSPIALVRSSASPGSIWFEKYPHLLIKFKASPPSGPNLRHNNGIVEFERVSTQTPETAKVLKVSTTPRQFSKFQPPHNGSTARRLALRLVVGFVPRPVPCLPLGESPPLCDRT
jgi:hypothetical protein